MRTPARAVAWDMTPIRRAWHLSRVALGVAVIAVMAAACGGTHAASPARSTSTTTTSSSTTTTTATDATHAAVLAAYRASQAAFEQAVDQADATVPALAQTMTGAQLQSVRRALLADKADGIVGRGTVALHPKVSSVNGDHAVVLDCAFDSSELVYLATGKPVPPVTPPEKVAIRSQLTKVGGVWKVAVQHTSGGSCPPGY